MQHCPACGAPWRRTLDYPEGVIRICAACGLQAGERSESGELGNEPDSAYYAMNTVDTLEYGPFRDFLATLRSLRGTGPLRLLDVGCGAGHFIRFCLENGIDAHGLEPDERARNHMPAEVAERVVFARAEDADFGKGSFDVITFWDSFEHIPAGFPLLDTVRSWLGPDGLVFLRVNNTRDVYNVASRTMLALAPPLGRKLVKSCFNLPSHVWNFSYTAMRLMAETHGWEILGHRFSDTPAERLFTNPALVLAAKTLYLCNACIGGGKIGEYYLRSSAAAAPTD